MALHSRPKRLAEEIRVALADIIQNELKDPRLSIAMVTVTQVEVTGDLRHANAWISVFASDEDTKSILQALGHSKSYIKHLLSERIVVKYLPDIHFKLDETGRQADRINRILKHIERVTPERDEPEKPDEPTA